MGKRVTMRDANGMRLDFPTELARNPHGTEFYFPYQENDPWFIPAGGWLINKPGTQIVGDGLDEAWGFRLAPNFDDPALGGTGDSVAFILSENRLRFENLSVSNDRGPIAGSGSAFLYRGTPTLPPQVGNVICQLTMDRVYVFYAGAHGFLSDPPPSAYYNNNNGFLIVAEFDQCWFYGCGGNGVRIDTASTTLRMKNVWIQQCGLQGLWVNGASTSSFDVICENNGRFLPAGNQEDAAIYLKNSTSSEITPYAENFACDGVKNAVLLDNCKSISVRSGGIFDYSGARGITGVRVRASKRCTVEPLHIVGCQADVNVESTSSRCVIFPQEGSIVADRRKNTIL